MSLFERSCSVDPREHFENRYSPDAETGCRIDGGHQTGLPEGRSGHRRRLIVVGADFAAAHRLGSHCECRPSVPRPLTETGFDLSLVRCD